MLKYEDVVFTRTRSVFLEVSVGEKSKSGLAGPILAEPKFLAIPINGPAKNGQASPAQIWAFPQHYSRWKKTSRGSKFHPSNGCLPKNINP